MSTKTRSPFLYPLRVLSTGTGYLSYFLSIIVFLSLGIPLLCVLGFWPGLMRRTMYRTLKAYAFFLTRLWLPFLRVYSIREISGYDKRSMTNVIFVANHRGRLDALLLLSMLPESGVLIKPKYTRIPIYSAFVKYLDFIRADSGSVASLAASLSRCKAMLNRGGNLLVFPEGTRAKSGKLQAFKDFTFKVAIESAKPVVPVIIHSDYPLMSRIPQSIFPRYRLHYTIRFLAPCVAREQERPSEYADRVHGIMAKTLADLDKGTSWDTSEAGKDAHAA
jgi:1-acyl-sn-glycerol-3-phosphate acyltransferase